MDQCVTDIFTLNAKACTTLQVYQYHTVNSESPGWIPLL